MKNILRTFTFCVKIQGCEESGFYLQVFVGLYWTGLKTRRQIAKKEMRLKKKEGKKERQRNGRRNICKEGRRKKPKMQACLNSEVIRKVKKSKKNKTKQSQNKVMYNNESTLAKTCTIRLFLRATAVHIILPPLLNRAHKKIIS